MIDSHTHLDVCKPPDGELVEAASAAGVRRIVTVGTGPASWSAALGAAEHHPGVYAALGHHSNEVSSFDAEARAELARLARHARCVAIGETGLDYYRRGAPPEAQAEATRAHAELARELDKPLVIHTRDAADDTIALLHEHAADLRVVLHCFSMDERVAECVAAGWWFSFAGNLTYPSADALRDAAAQVPAGRLLVETDAPFLSPQPVRKQRNEPAFVVHTARVLAQVRGEDYDALEATLEANAAALFGW